MTTSTVLAAAASAETTVSPMFLLVFVAFFALMIVSMWKLFAKADEPGWHALVPFLNTWTMLKIVGRPGWWFVLLFIPFVSFVISIIMVSDLAKSFGKSMGYTVGLIFLPFVFIPMLGLGDSEYEGPSAS